MLAPIPAETVFLLAGSGWSLERLLLCCIERLGALSNAPSASGPTPSLFPDNSTFREAARLLRQFQSEDRVRIKLVREDGQANVFLVLDGVRDARHDRLETLLGLPMGANRILLTGAGGAGEDGDLIAQSRSILGALYVLSHAVDVPEAHRAAGLVTVSHTASGAEGDWDAFLGGSFDVRSSADQPDNAFVSVRYRGYWFWIADDDLDAKTSFSLLNFLLALQSAASNGHAPLLTINAAR